MTKHEELKMQQDWMVLFAKRGIEVISVSVMVGLVVVKTKSQEIADTIKSDFQKSGAFTSLNVHPRFDLSDHGGRGIVGYDVFGEC